LARQQATPGVVDYQWRDAVEQGCEYRWGRVEIGQPSAPNDEQPETASGTL